MKHRSTALTFLAALLVVASVASTAFTQDATDTLRAHPRYARPTPHLRSDVAPPATPLTTWNGSFSYSGHTYKYNMVGTSPTTGVSTTVPVFLIPIALQYKSGTTTTTFSPAHVLSNGQTVIANTVASPVFQSGIDFNQGGTDLGNTQYIDAYQRGNFWSRVSKAPGYHLLLGAPRVAPVQTIVVPSADGRIGTEFGVKVGLADINWFDAQVNALITKFAVIQPNSLPIFITYDVYLTESGGCCLGGSSSPLGIPAAPAAHLPFHLPGQPAGLPDALAPAP